MESQSQNTYKEPQLTLESELISRYKVWLTSGTWSSTYWKNKGHWRSEVEQKIKELQKINK